MRALIWTVALMAGVLAFGAAVVAGDVVRGVVLLAVVVGAVAEVARHGR